MKSDDPESFDLFRNEPKSQTMFQFESEKTSKNRTQSHGNSKLKFTFENYFEDKDFSKIVSSTPQSEEMADLDRYSYKNISPVPTPSEKSQEKIKKLSEEIEEHKVFKLEKKDEIDALQKLYNSDLEEEKKTKYFGKKMFTFTKVKKRFKDFKSKKEKKNIFDNSWINSKSVIPQFYKLISSKIKSFSTDLSSDLRHHKFYSKKSENIKKFLLHLEIVEKENNWEYFDSLLFCLSKIFNFIEILKSNQFVIESETLNPKSNRSQFLKKRGNFGYDEKNIKSSSIQALKILFFRLLTIFEYYKKFKKQITGSKDHTLAFLSPLFDANKKMIITEEFIDKSVKELVQLFDFSEIQDYFLLCSSGMLEKSKRHLTIYLKDQSGTIKTVKMTRKMLGSLCFTRRKTNCVLFIYMFKFLWQRFKIFCKEKNQSFLSCNEILSQHFNRKISNFKYNKCNFRIIKSYPPFNDFWSSIDIKRVFVRKILTDRLKYIHLKKIDIEESSEESYFLNRFRSYLNNPGKKPASLFELVTSYISFKEI